jgi:hypothetical protein
MVGQALFISFANLSTALSGPADPKNINLTAMKNVAQRRIAPKIINFLFIIRNFEYAK